MQQWYMAYYKAIPQSKAYSEFCRRVFGRDLGQHGFSDMAQIDRLIELAALGTGDRALDLGCGNGQIAEYISDQTEAHVTGLDYIPAAIEQAQRRSESKRRRLAFVVGDIGNLPFAAHSFDVLISIDTLYFTDLNATVGQMKGLLKPGGRMAIFYAHGADPQCPLEQFSRATLPPDKTPLGEVLTKHGLPFQTWDFTAADYAHAQLKEQVTEALKSDFAAEENSFLYDSRHGEAVGVMAAIEAGTHARYLYLVKTRSS